MGGNPSTPRRRDQVRMQVLQCHCSSPHLRLHHTRQDSHASQVQVEGSEPCENRPGALRKFRYQ